MLNKYKYLLISSGLYLLSCGMPTGIGIVKGDENIPGMLCLWLGGLSILSRPLDFVFWLTNFAYFYALYLAFSNKHLGRAFACSSLAFLFASIYIVIERFISVPVYQNYACYIWALSYFVLSWRLCHVKLVEDKWSGTMVIVHNVVGCMVTIALLYGLFTLL